MLQPQALPNKRKRRSLVSKILRVMMILTIERRMLKSPETPKPQEESLPVARTSRKIRRNIRSTRIRSIRKTKKSEKVSFDLPFN